MMINKQQLMPFALFLLCAGTLFAVPSEPLTEADAAAVEASAVEPEAVSTPEPAAEPTPSAKAGGGGDKHDDDGHDKSRFSDQPSPLRFDLVPDRPRPILELGEPYLGTGTLSPGFQLPTGAVWQPALVVFADMRTAVQSFDRGSGRRTEAVGRLDLSANLQLSGSERIVLGFRNLDQDGNFTGHVFEDPNANNEGGTDELNADIRNLFFEGDFGEIFPNLSPMDFSATDFGFSIGRQGMFFQEGILINDSIDGFGLTRNTLQPRNTANFRTTLFYGWNGVNRNNRTDDSGELFALLTSTDFRASTMDIDVAYVRGNEELGYEDLLVAGISGIQRIGLVNTSFRALGSFSDFDGEEGVLLFSEVSWTPHHTHDLVYINNFYGIDNYTPAAWGNGNPGPLARIGVAFAGVGMGNYGSPLTPVAGDVAGGAFGYQRFFAHNRHQLVAELAGRVGVISEQNLQDQYAFVLRYRVALGRRFMIQVDGYALQQPDSGLDDETAAGGRLELLIRL